MKKYMVIERFKHGCVDKCYERFEEKGRMLPEGLFYLNSWVNKQEGVCFQLMETNRPELFPVWFNCWEDLVDFQLCPLD